MLDRHDQYKELYVKQVATIDIMQITSDGSKVTFKSWLSPKYPANVMVASAITLANVPASVDSRPPLNVPRESLDDITRDRSDKFTPGAFTNDNNKMCHVEVLTFNLFLLELTMFYSFTYLNGSQVRELS